MDIGLKNKGERAQRTLAVQKDRLVDMLEVFFLRSIGRSMNIDNPKVPDSEWMIIANEINLLGPAKPFQGWKQSFKFLKIRVKEKLLKDGIEFEYLLECEQKICNMFGQQWLVSDSTEQDEDEMDEDDADGITMSCPSQVDLQDFMQNPCQIGESIVNRARVPKLTRARETVSRRARTRGGGQAKVRGKGNVKVRGSRRGVGLGSVRGARSFQNSGRILEDQKDRLLSLVEEKFLQVVGRYSGPDGVEYKKRLWERFANELNLLGPARAGTEWKKTFDYMKSSAKASLNAIRQHIKTYDEISQHEARIIDMFGMDLLDGHRKLGEGGFVYQKTMPKNLQNTAPGNIDNGDNDFMIDDHRFDSDPSFPINTNEQTNSESHAGADSNFSTTEEAVCLSDDSDTEKTDDLKDIRVPLEKGWRRETVIRGLTRTMQIRGDVCYYAPGSELKLKNFGEVDIVLKRQHSDLSASNFSFSPLLMAGSFLQLYVGSYEIDRLTSVEMAKRLELYEPHKSKDNQKSTAITSSDHRPKSLLTENQSLQSDFVVGQDNESEYESIETSPFTNTVSRVDRLYHIPKSQAAGSAAHFRSNVNATCESNTDDGTAMSQSSCHLDFPGGSVDEFRQTSTHSNSGDRPFNRKVGGDVNEIPTMRSSSQSVDQDGQYGHGNTSFARNRGNVIRMSQSSHQSDFPDGPYDQSGHEFRQSSTHTNSGARPFNRNIASGNVIPTIRSSFQSYHPDGQYDQSEHEFRRTFTHLNTTAHATHTNTTARVLNGTAAVSGNVISTIGSSSRSRSSYGHESIAMSRPGLNRNVTNSGNPPVFKRSGNNGRTCQIGASHFQSSVNRIVRTNNGAVRRPLERVGRQTRNRVTSYEMVEESLNLQERFIYQSERNHLETINLCTVAMNNVSHCVREIFGKDGNNRSIN